MKLDLGKKSVTQQVYAGDVIVTEEDSYLVGISNLEFHLISLTSSHIYGGFESITKLVEHITLEFCEEIEEVIESKTIVLSRN
jgi:hypothetical protein